MDHIYIIGIAQAVFASVFFFLRRNRFPASAAAGLFMIFLALPMVSNLLKGLLSSWDTLLFLFIHAAPFTFGPFLYIYTVLIIDEHPHIKKSHLLHFVPFIIFSALILSGLNFTPPGAETLSAGSEKSFLKHGLDIRWVIKYCLINLSYMAYTALILARLHRHKKNIGEYFSSESSEITLSWLKSISIFFILCNISISLLILISPFFFESYTFKPGVFVDYGLTFFIFVFSLFSGKQPLVYSRKHNRYEAESQTERYLKSGLKDETALKYHEAIEEAMIKEKLYLNSELTIEDLSNALNIKRHYITQILNSRFDVNFNTYVNSFRIKYVIENLRSDVHSDKSMLELAMEAGFNSKATFNRFFKNSTGITPSEYKKTILNEK